MPPDDSATRQLESTLSGRYRLERELGRGGMAVVYEAHDLRHDRKVAIKVLSAEVLRSIGRDRFQREIEIAARLNHPHIVPLFDSGETTDSLYYVMPRIEGESLRKRLSRERLPVSEAIRLAGEIAGALEHAHRRGLIHRDIKPDNVLLSENIALVADFGIARVAARPAGTDGGSGPETMTAMIVGTPAYMSPEQAAPGAGLDGRADVYSLGCVVYEMLAGQPPFQAPDVWTLLGRHANDPVPPLTSHRPEVPHAVVRVVEKALSKRQEERYPTAAAFGEALRLAAHESSTKRADVPSARGRLPVPRTTFVGREVDVDGCAHALDLNRMVTLTGVGGSGKTRLALETASRVEQEFRDGAVWVDFTPLSDESRMAEAVAEALGILNPQRPPREALLDFVKERHLLLLFDNCEHLVGPIGELADAILTTSEECRILATSREGLGVDGEQILAVRPLTLPRTTTDPEAIASSDAVRLFAERARAVQPGFAVNDTNATDLLDICRRLDGIPLAIELAAAHARILSVRQIRDRLEDQLSLSTGRGRALPRHQTLRATLQWSYALLTPEEQRILRHLSVFRGAWTLSAAAAVSGADAESDLLDVLWRLTDKSLVEVVTTEESEARYRLLEMVRQFAFDALVAADEAKEAQARHAAHYLERLEAEAPRLIGPEEHIAAADLERDLDNILAALDESLRLEGGTERAMRAASDAWPLWVARGHISLGDEVIVRLLGNDAAGRTLGRAKALMLSSMLARFAGRHERAREEASASVELHEALGEDGSGLAFALFQRGVARLNIPGADLEASRVDMHRAIEVARSGNDPMLVSVCLNLLGVLAVEGHDLETAERHFLEALAVSAELRSPYLRILYEMNLGAAHAQQGRWQEALRAVSTATSLTRECGNRHFAPPCVVGAAVVLTGLGDRSTGIRLFGAARNMFASIGEETPGQDLAIAVERMRACGAQPESEEYRRHYAEGDRLSFEQALAEAAAALERHRSTA